MVEASVPEENTDFYCNKAIIMTSAGFRIYEVPYLGPEGGRPGRPT